MHEYLIALWYWLSHMKTAMHDSQSVFDLLLNSLFSLPVFLYTQNVRRNTAVFIQSFHPKLTLDFLINIFTNKLYT